MMLNNLYNRVSREPDIQEIYRLQGKIQVFKELVTLPETVLAMTKKVST